MSSPSSDQVDYSMFFAVMGCVASVGLCAIGAAYGTAKSSSGIFALAVMRPELMMKSLTPVVMAGILGIYGLVVSMLIATEFEAMMTLRRSFLFLGGGLCAGLCCVGSGVAIGIAGDSGVRGLAQQPKLFVGIMLVLIFAEVLGIYGLIVSVYLVKLIK